MKRTDVVALVVLTLGLQTAAARAQEAQAADPAADAPAWGMEMGLSYLATSGNSDTETLGVDLEAVRRPEPWGLEVAAQFNRAEQDGAKTAERSYAGVRATRRLTERWDAFAGLSAEQDEFSGIDLRGVVEAGAAYKALVGPRHELDLDVALTWTDEQRLPPGMDDSWLGALLGTDYSFAISENATFSQQLRYFPNVDQTDDWRADSVTALTAALNRRLAVRVSHEIRYRNEPLGDNDDTDTTSKVSLVWSR
jgi:putative salt-induced outer membrane protein